MGNSSYPNYLDLRERVTTLESVYAYSLFPRAMSLGGGEASGGALVLSMDPTLPIVSAQALEDVMALGLVPQRVVVSSSGSLGLVGRRCWRRSGFTA